MKLFQSKSRLLMAGAIVASALLAGAHAQAPAVTGPFDHLQLEVVAEGFTAPLKVTSPPNDERLFVMDQTGVILIIDADGNRVDEPFLDISDRMVEVNVGYDERGLLGLAFHPDYANNGLFYVYYSAPLRDSAPGDWDHTSHVSQFKVSSDANVADAASELIRLYVDEPQSNHNGGEIAFGPDGYLYVSLGDGGAANDVALGHPPLGNGQDVSTILGSLLRIDVSTADGYAIPGDNPLVGVTLPDNLGYQSTKPKEEIYAWGLRNPYRFSFDREGGVLWMPDVGQNLWEEVNVVYDPGNYGWNLKEGKHGFDPANPNQTPAETPTTDVRGEPLIDPIFDYTRESVDPQDFIGITVIGGHVYRGSAIDGLQGNYVFGDWGQSFTDPTGTLIIGQPVMTGDRITGLDIVFERRLDEFVMGFGEDSKGEIYVATKTQTGPEGNTGKIYRIVPGSSTGM
jgi:glucose/arabinose dehydrogenase